MGEVKFLLTAELGRLARWLRLLGYDTAYASREQDVMEIFIEAMTEDRVIVARDRRFHGGRAVKVVRIQSDRVKEQLKEVFSALRLVPSRDLIFTRCLKCNRPLEEMAKSEAAGKVPAYVFETQKRFVTCSVCKQIFWAGTHVGLAESFLEEATGVSL